MGSLARVVLSGRGAVLSVLVARVCLAAGDAEAEAPRVEVSAGAREEYRLRYSPEPDQSAQDLRLTLDLGVADPSGRFLGAANLGLFWTLRRATESGTTDGLGTVLDGRNPFFDVYLLTGEYRGAGPLSLVRVGRQATEHGRAATFDGASVLVRPTKALSLFAFGGRGAYFFEVPTAGAAVFDDWLASAGVGYRPLPWLRLEADYRLLVERALDPDRARVGATNHSWGLSAWVRSDDALWARLTVRGLKDSFAEASLSGHAFFARPGLGVDALALVQPVTLNALDEQTSPFFLTLGPSLPHARWRLEVSRVFTLQRGSLEARLGWNGRHLLRDAETPFNRNTGRLSLLGAARDVLLPGLSAQVSLERLTSSAVPVVGRGIFTVNGSAAYQRGRVRGELGAQYYSYQYTYYADVEELADVRVVFAEVRVKALDWLAVRGRYQLELFDRTRHSFTVSVSQRY